jgi:hypothetical protein
MPYTLEEKRTYQQPAEAVFKAAIGAIEGLEGKVVKHNLETGMIEAKFNKRIHGNTLGDRTQVEIDIASNSTSETNLSLVIYPIDPVGRKLQFGARKGVSNTVKSWFFAHVDHRLGT